MSLQRPASINDLIAHAKMKIGEPVIRVNVTEDQCIAAVYEAVDRFTDYHDEASDEGIFIVEITEQIAADQGFEVPEETIAILEVLGMSGGGTSISGGGEEYSISNQHFMIGGVHDKVSMFLAQRDLSYLRNVLRPPPVYRFNQSTRFLHIEERSEEFVVGYNIMYRATFSLGDISTRFWRDVWLIKYTTALIKRQWGNNITKYTNVELPGGYTLNGDQLLSSAKEEIKELEEELYENASVMRTVMTIA